MKKKLIGILLSLAMVMTLFAGITGMFPQVVAAAEPTVVAVDNDGNNAVTSSKFDEYFENSASEGIAALLDAGGCYVNGVKVPQTADETTVYQVNQVDSIYKTDTGWGVNVHKTTTANTLTFTEARKTFFDTISTVRGHKTYFYLDENGICTAVNIESFDVVRVASVEDMGHDRVIDRGEFALETNRVRPDVNEIHFYYEDFDIPVDYDGVAVYWYGSETPGETAVWHLGPATAMEGVITKNDSGWYVVNAGQEDEYACIESNVSRYNLIDSSRPTQGYTAYTRLGLQAAGREIVMWNTPNGYPIGFTFGVDTAASKANLQVAINNAKQLVAETEVSEDGTDVPSSKRWANQAAFEDFEAAIAEAEEVYKKNSAAHIDVDSAIYALSKA